MATYNGENYTSFKGVNLRNTGAIRLEMDGGFNGSVSVKASPDASRAWQFPDKSGTFPIMGTFAVQLPTATKAIYSTIVTVSGIRAEDALVVQLNGANNASTTYGFGNSTGIILVNSIPGNGNITLFFSNPGNATGYVDLRASYLAAR